MGLPAGFPSPTLLDELSDFMGVMRACLRFYAYEAFPPSGGYMARACLRFAA